MKFNPSKLFFNKEDEGVKKNVDELLENSKRLQKYEGIEYKASELHDKYQTYYGFGLILRNGKAGIKDRLEDLLISDVSKKNYDDITNINEKIDGYEYALKELNLDEELILFEYRNSIYGATALLGLYGALWPLKAAFHVTHFLPRSAGIISSKIASKKKANDWIKKYKIDPKKLNYPQEPFGVGSAIVVWAAQTAGLAVLTGGWSIPLAIMGGGLACGTGKIIIDELYHNDFMLKDSISNFKKSWKTNWNYKNIKRLRKERHDISDLISDFLDKR